MKEWLKTWLKENAKTIGTLVGGFITAAVLALTTCSCSSVQRINVKQSQGDQQQETTIESDTKFKSVSFVFNTNSSNIELQ